MSIHRYQMRNIWSDYARGGAGMAIGIGGLSLAPTSTHVVVIFGALTVLFLIFTLRTAARQREWIELAGDGLSIGRVRQLLLRWDDLNHVKLRYYSTRRNRADGWMVMNLTWPAKRLVIYSNIDGFDAIAAGVAGAVRRNGIALDSASTANLAAMGLIVAADADSIAGSTAEGAR
jgi:hypothetical protein